MIDRKASDLRPGQGKLREFRYNILDFRQLPMGVILFADQLGQQSFDCWVRPDLSIVSPKNCFAVDIETLNLVSDPLDDLSPMKFPRGRVKTIPGKAIMYSTGRFLAGHNAAVANDEDALRFAAKLEARRPWTHDEVRQARDFVLSKMID